MLVEAKRHLIPVSNQIHLPVYYKDSCIGCSFIDLLFWDDILVELKIGNHLSKKDFDQINEYLKLLNKKLALLTLYSSKGVVIRRVVNL